MKLSKSIQLAHLLSGSIRDIYCQAISNHLTHDWILNKLKVRVFTDKEYMKAPKWVHNYLSGYKAALLDHLLEEHLHTGRMYKGVLYEKWDDMTEELKEMVRKDMDSVPMATYWNDSMDPF